VSKFSHPSRLVALLSLPLLLLPFLSLPASAAPSLTCYKGSLVKIVKTKTCPAGYSKTKPVSTKSKVATYYNESLANKKTFLDPRSSKNIPAPVIQFWKDSNEIAYYVYAVKQDELTLQTYNNNVWFTAIIDGYQPQAALDSTNASQSGLWYRTKYSNSYITPDSAPCTNPGSAIRYQDYSYTCLDTLVYGVARDINTISASDLATLNPISAGDGYDPDLPAAPGRRCFTKNAVTNLYGVGITCIFMAGTIIPQTSQIIQLINTTSQIEYCLIDQPLLVQETNPSNFITLALITTSCESYLKTHTLKTIKKQP